MRKSEYPKEFRTLGQKIRRARLDMGKYLIEVAEFSGVTEGYLSRIERDKQLPSRSVIRRIALTLRDKRILVDEESREGKIIKRLRRVIRLALTNKKNIYDSLDELIKELEEKGG